MAVLVSDSFNRANSTTTLGSTDNYSGGTTKTWTSQDATGAWGISTNRAYVATDSTSRTMIIVPSGVSDCTVEIDFTWATGAYAGLTFRNSDISNYFDLCIDSTGLILRKSVSASYTILGTYAFTPVNGTIYHITATLNGNSIIASLNGTQRITASDSFNVSATQHGFRKPTVTSGVFFDNFVVSTGPTIQDGTASIKGTGTISANANKIQNGLASLQGFGLFSPTANLIKQGTTNLLGTGLLTANGTLIPGIHIIDGTTTLIGTGNFTANAHVVHIAVTMDGQFVAIGTGFLTVNGDVVMVKPRWTEAPSMAVPMYAVVEEIEKNWKDPEITAILFK